MTDDPLIFPSLGPLYLTCPHCGRTGSNQRVECHYEPDFRVVKDGEICDGCGKLVPFPHG